ncbi:PocR ligand-binding domain-containing protein [Catenovulum sp. SX2]|uniref:PocR ligand-binding domain-containing protein n=1 Tax=Catenovulum sp. SX2 TaxID=3398614 RepID=UPI003F82DF48
MKYDPNLLIAPQYFIKDLIDIEQLTTLLEKYSLATGMVTALLDLEGNVLIATNWQDSCTKFHRQNATTCANCLESDTILAGQLAAGDTYNVYRCKNGLVDVATPVKIADQHVANLFTGQFFFETPDIEHFRQRAKNLGFDEEAYIDAIQRVPVYSEEKIKAHFDFLSTLAQTIAEMGANAILMERLNQQVLAYNQSLTNSFADFIEIAPVGVFKMNARNGKFILVNEQFAKLLGVHKDTLTGQDLSPYLTQINQQQLQQQFALLKKTNFFGPFELQLDIDKADSKVVMLHGILTREESGEKTIWTIVQDISEIKEIELNLREAKAKAEYANRAKSDFLANMSHEIRTPMNAIFGTLQTLQMTKSLGSEQILVDQALYSARSLLTIINDILDYSKIEAQKLELEEVPILIEQVVSSICSDLNPVASAKNISLHLKVDKNFEDGWIGDPVRIRQIILNLTSNAVKFTQQGSVTISLKQIKKADTYAVKIEIKDTGIGMDKKGLAALFARFEQADSSTTRQYGGTGLGMAISKNLVDMMNGKISVKSQLGVGSQFSIELPLAKADASQLSASHIIDVKPPNLAGKHILIAEDNEINQSVIECMLKPTKAICHFAADGLIAVNEFKRLQPELILMDIQMPNMDGVQACIQIKSQNKEIPIIALTANVMSEDVEVYKQTGFDQYVGKPIELSELYCVLSTYSHLTAKT